MPRLRQILIAAAAALAGCSPAPDVSWLTQPTRDQHSSAYFPIVTGPHAADCNTCHGTSNSFRNFDCVGCHLQAPTATIHAAIGGYSYDSQSCYGCHTDGVGQGSIDHRRNFPIAAGQIHAIGAQAMHVPGTIQCTSCHTNASDRTKVDCTSCHTSAAMQPLHVAVADLPATYASPDATYKTSTLCLTCHADSTVPVTITRPHSPPAPAHAPFLIGSGEAHYQKSCLGCHVALRTDKPWAADFTKPQRCTGCHVEPATSSNHLGTSWAGYSGTYAYSDAACLRCHMDGDIGPFDHSADFPIMASDVHRSGVAPCLSCHTSSSTPADVSTIGCVRCHNNGASSVDAGGVNAKHTTPAATTTLIGFGYSFDTSTQAATVSTNGLCLKCHAGTIATKTWTNPLVMPIATHSSLCFDVTSGNHRVNQTKNGVPACFVCHNTMNAGSRPWGVNWTQVSCTACHSSRSFSACK